VTTHRAAQTSPERLGRPVACSAVTAAAVGVTCASTGPVRLAGALILLGALVCALWIAHHARFAALGPAIGLALAFLVLIGLALAAGHALSTAPIALAIGAVTLAAAWAGRLYPAAGVPGHRTPVKRPNLIAVGGAVIFAAAAVFAVHYSALSARADSARACCLAVWAYPSGPSGAQLQVGAQQPAGHGPTSLRIVVAEAGITAAAWNDVHLAPGQTWRAPPLTMTGNGPATVIARRGRVVVASFSFGAPRIRAAAHPATIRKPPRHRWSHRPHAS
jgi:hypothetical protein